MKKTSNAILLHKNDNVKSVKKVKPVKISRAVKKFIKVIPVTAVKSQ